MVLKCHSGLPVRVGACVGQVINGVFDKIWLTMGSVCPQIHAVAISQVSECIIEVDILSTRQNLYVGSLTCSMRAILVGKAKQKPLKLSLSGKRVNKNNTTSLAGLQRLSLSPRNGKIYEWCFPP